MSRSSELADGDLQDMHDDLLPEQHDFSLLSRVPQRACPTFPKDFIDPSPW